MQRWDMCRCLRLCRACDRARWSFPARAIDGAVGSGGSATHRGIPAVLLGPRLQGDERESGKEKKIKQPRRIFPATSRLDQTRLRAPSGLRSDVTPDEAEFKIVSIAPWWPCPSRLYKCPVFI